MQQLFCEKYNRYNTSDTFKLILTAIITPNGCIFHFAKFFLSHKKNVKKSKKNS